MNKPHTPLLILPLLLIPVMACADAAFSAQQSFDIQQFWQDHPHTQDGFVPYQNIDFSKVAAAAWTDGGMKAQSFDFAANARESGQFNFDYPDILLDDNDTPAYLSDLRPAPAITPWQNSRVYKLIPKDLMPYLGLRVKYNLTDKVGLVNDITPKNIFYGLTYLY